MRHVNIRHLKRISLKLQPLRDRLRSSLPLGSPARNLNIPLIMFLARHLDYPDSNLARDLTKGMDITGKIPESKALTKRIVAPTTDLAGIKLRLVTRNRTILRHLRRQTDPILRNKCWEMSVLEHQKGWLSRPTPVTQNDRTNTIMSPRFCISEQHGTQAPKYRVIDDLSKSKVNATVGTHDTYCPRIWTHSWF